MNVCYISWWIINMVRWNIEITRLSNILIEWYEYMVYLTMALVKDPSSTWLWTGLWDVICMLNMRTIRTKEIMLYIDILKIVAFRWPQKKDLCLPRLTSLYSLSSEGLLVSSSCIFCLLRLIDDENGCFFRVRFSLTT